MVDIVSIQAGLSSIEVATNLVRGLSSASGAIEKAELKLKLAELMTSLADAKISMVDARDQIHQLQQELKNRVELSALQTEFVDGLYLELNVEGVIIDGPFCGRCWDVDSRKIRPANDRSGERGMGYCPECKNKYPLWNAEKKMIDAGAKEEFTG